MSPAGTPSVTWRELAGLVLSSALITLDGTATTIALPAIGSDLGIPVYRLQWISNTPLLVLVALLLPFGTVADRFGRGATIRTGLIVFAVGAVVSLLASNDKVLIGGRALQGAGGALILPASLAALRGVHHDAGERARLFGIWAAWTGVASAAGPLLSGGLVDLFSWRAVFALSVSGSIVGLVLLIGRIARSEPMRPQPLPLLTSVSLMAVVGACAYLLTTAASGGLASWLSGVVLGVGTVAALSLARDPRRKRLFPRELVRSRNCLPANASTFALYFGMFGLSFLVALYTQQALGYSALRAALALLPVSLMLLLAERFGRLAPRLGTRTMIVCGVTIASAGLLWIATGTHPLPFWSRLVVGTGAFGIGVSLAVSALTHAAVAAVPETCAGAASGLNHAVVRGAGLIAIALLGSLAAPGLSDAVVPEGFRAALLVCAAVVLLVGIGGTAAMRDEEPGGLSNAA